MPESWPWQTTAVAGLIGATIGLLTGVALLRPEAVAPSTVLASLAGAIAAEDHARLRVPDVLNVGAAITGLAFAALFAIRAETDPIRSLLWVLLQMALCGGALLFVREAFFRLRGIDGLGLGDVKLGAAAGAWISAEDFALAVLTAALVALISIGFRQWRERAWAAQHRVPFAFFLAPAIWLCWLKAELLPAY